MTRLFLERGADSNAASKYGETPLLGKTSTVGSGPLATETDGTIQTSESKLHSPSSRALCGNTESGEAPGPKAGFAFQPLLFPPSSQARRRRGGSTGGRPAGPTAGRKDDCNGLGPTGPRLGTRPSVAQPTIAVTAKTAGRPKRDFISSGWNSSSPFVLFLFSLQD
ncbi:hypothetical protein F5883DRAFT_49090 [Diaporthe sp. PMI_573]|nr:hypothetical protein F5883DRAFT_49090 [Diaporthaceae sp. PMI_573]